MGGGVPTRSSGFAAQTLALLLCLWGLQSAVAQDCGGSPCPVRIVAAVLPSSRTVQVGEPLTAFATILNFSQVPLHGCRIEVESLPATFFFQVTDPATNELVGVPDQAVEIAPLGSQTFLIGLIPHEPFGPSTLVPAFLCDNSAPAEPNIANLLLVAATTDPTPDVIAIARTLEGDGIVTLNGDRLGAFSVAAANVGATGVLEAVPIPLPPDLPVTLLLCRTDTGGLCLEPPAARLEMEIEQDATPSFAVFALGSAPIPLTPDTRRVVLRFLQDGVIRGATSVALRSP